MKRLNLSKETNFIGSWNLNDTSLCNKIIDFFENNKKLQIQGQTGSGIDQTKKNSIDVIVDPKNLNDEKYLDLKIYIEKLFECYLDYKKQWPFLDNNFKNVDIPSFNIQKYEEGGHFSFMHCERSTIQSMHRIFAWMTYLNDVQEGGDTYFKHFDLKIKPEVGKTLIWPAEWTHAHRGEVLKKGSKYIVTGWMHFPFNYKI